MIKYCNFLLFLLFFSFLHKTVYSQIEIDARYVILQDHLSGEILYEKEADGNIYPASMTKIMTAIVVFDLLKKGETSLDEEIVVSEKAWRMSQSGYSSMFIMLNDRVTVEELLKGIIIVSGNDACVALAEGLSGTEKDFVNLMNEKAREIGLENTNFGNSSGINDVENFSTVRDILKMSQYMIKNFPEYYSYFKDTSFTWDRTGGDPITQGNRNPLLYKNIGVDGIKTGFLEVEKYTIMVAKKNFPIQNLYVWLGKKNYVETVVDKDIYLTVPKRKKKSIKAIIEYNSPIEAPIKKGDILGTLNIYKEGELTEIVDLLSNENIKKANIFSRLFQSLNYLVWGDA